MQQSAAPARRVSPTQSVTRAKSWLASALEHAGNPSWNRNSRSAWRAAWLRLAGVLLLAASLLQVPNGAFGQADATKSPTGKAGTELEPSTPGGGSFTAADEPALKTLSVPLDNGPDDVDAPLLKVPTTVSLIDVPLIDAMQHISQVNEVAILLDSEALEDQGVLQDEPVSLHLDAPMPLHRLLDVLLQPLELTWYMHDGLIHVTTPEAHDERLIRRMYDVESLRRRGVTADTLLDVLVTHSHSEWMNYDGYGGEVVLVGNTLVVSASYQAQRHVRALLQSLVAPVDGSPVQNALEYAKVDEVLNRRATFQFSDVPLLDVANAFSHEVGHPVVVNSRALEDSGIKADEPVSLVLNDVPLRTVLEIVLSPLGCAVVTNAGMIEITSKEVAAETTLTAVYDLRSTPLAAREQFVAMLSKATGGEWVDYDGSGGDLTLCEDGLLVITHTEPVHAEVRRLLAGWRLTDRRLQAGQQADAGNQIERRIYQLDLSTAQDLVVQLPALVMPDTWQSKNRPDGGRVALVRIGTPPAPVSPPAKEDGTNDKKKKSDSDKPEDQKQATADRVSSLPVPTVLSQFGGGVITGPGFGSGGMGASTACYGMYQSGLMRQAHYPYYSAALVVDQTPFVHDAIDQLLADLGIVTQGFKPVDQDAADSYDQISP